MRALTRATPVWTRGRILAVLVGGVSLAVVSGLGCDSAEIDGMVVVPGNVLGQGYSDTYTGNAAILTGYAEIDVVSVPSGGGAGLVMRHNTGANDYICAFADNGSGVAEVGIADGQGTFTGSYVVNTAYTIPLATTIKLGCEITAGGTLNVYVNRELAYSYALGTDGADTVFGAGSWGFFTGDTPGISIDNFKLYSALPF